MPTVKIKIIDTNNRPVPFAAVSLAGIKAPADHNGIATLNVPNSGNLKLEIRSPIHAPYSGIIKVPPIEHTIQLTPATF